MQRFYTKRKMNLSLVNSALNYIPGWVHYLKEITFFLQVHHHLSTHHPDLVGTIVDNHPEFKCIFCGKTMNSGTFYDN